MITLSFRRSQKKGGKVVIAIFPLLLLLQLKIFLQNFEPYVMPLVIGMDVFIRYISANLLATNLILNQNESISIIAVFTTGYLLCLYQGSFCKKNILFP